MQFKFEVTMVGLPLWKWEIDSTILDLWKWKEADFDKNIKFIILNYFIEKMRKSWNPIEQLWADFFEWIFQEANEWRNPDNLVLPKGLEITIII